MNHKSHDDLTRRAELTTDSLDLPFASSDLQSLGIRTTRAEFARLMGCSRQAVTDWVNGGRILVGPDGRFDPRQAVRSLLATGDPTRLRARILQPLYDEMAQLRSRIVALELAALEASEDAEFHEGSAAGYAAVFQALCEEIADHWPAMIAAPGDAGKEALLAWLDEALGTGTLNAGTVLDYLPSAAPGESEREEGAPV